MDMKLHFFPFITPLLLCLVTSERRSELEIAESLLQFYKEGTKHFYEEPPDAGHILPEYDFVVVGAGSAGCVVANRLSQLPEWKVLLIEAGRPENYVMDVPLTALLLQLTEANWKYKTVPSDNVCLGMKNGQCSYPRGKAVGGSSSINFMIHTRGNRRDYNRWRDLGNHGWGYEDLLPYFRKIEDMTIPGLSDDREYHSVGGEVTISYAPQRTLLAEAFVEGGRQMGERFVDYNGKTQTGFSYIQTTIRNGTRLSASKAFLHPIRHRKNLHLKKRSQVTKILIEPTSKTAYGVEFVQNKKKYVVHARNEIIISAGTVNSPQILMLSGIGPKQHLEANGIPIIQDLKVGFNLMDHPGFIGLSVLVNESVGIVINEVLADDKNLVDYLKYHQGPFAIPAMCEGIAYFDTENPSSEDGDPDLELLFFGGTISSESTFYKTLNIRENVNKAVFKPTENAHGWTAVPLTLKPKSRGRVMLKSRNPFHPPLIYHDFFKESYDIEMQLVGVKKIIELINTNAFKKYGSRINDYPVPGCQHLVFGSDEYWICAIRHLSIGIWHLGGTCKMGPVSDPTSVVDSRLRVHGVKGLRVIDASIMPILPAAHTNTPAMMIGAKGADLVRQDWGVWLT